jgi:hypothetical protein
VVVDDGGVALAVLVRTTTGAGSERENDKLLNMNSRKKDSCKRSLGRSVRSSVFRSATLVWISLSVLCFGFPALAQSQQPPIVPAGQSSLPDAPAQDQQSPGSISGTVVDVTEMTVAGASVKLARDGQTESEEVTSGDDGQFSFANVAPGSFQLTITADGFATQTFSGTLHSGEFKFVPPIALAVAANVTEVRVVVPRAEIAEEQIKIQEKQRVLGVIPNFYVSYIPDAAPLDAKQKFELASKLTVDPVTIGLTGAVAGVQQEQNNFRGFGQGAEGYGKRFGASYADIVTSTFIGSAMLPSLLKQDPRYFYKGTGSTRSRILHAMANAVICKGDNGHWQPNYSGILGSLAAGAIANLYYPNNSRNGAALTFEIAATDIGTTAVSGLLQEFVMRKLTPHLSDHDPAKL